MNSTQTMMFEVADLAFASPATVSRCGMIYMEPGALGNGPLVQSWLNKQKQSMSKNHYTIFRPQANNLFDLFLEPCLEFWQMNLKEAVPTTSGNLTCSLMKILGSLLNPQFNGANVRFLEGFH